VVRKRLGPEAVKLLQEVASKAKLRQGKKGVAATATANPGVHYCWADVQQQVHLSRSFGIDIGGTKGEVGVHGRLICCFISPLHQAWLQGSAELGTREARQRVVAFKPRRMKFAMHAGAFDPSAVELFVLEVLSGDRPFTALGAIPQLI
jgi:hypothetical protein